MSYMSLLLILISHFYAIIKFFKAYKSGLVPSTASFAAVGVVLYYDIGLIMEMFGFDYKNPYFESIFNKNYYGYQLVLMFVFIIIAPWCFYFGSHLYNRTHASVKAGIIPEYLNRIRFKNFKIITFIVSIFFLFIGWRNFSSILHDYSLWIARNIIGETFGPLVIIFSIPKCFLVFYLSQNVSWRSPSFVFTIIFLSGVAIICSLPMGQRSEVLSIILILLLAYVFRQNRLIQTDLYSRMKAVLYPQKRSIIALFVTFVMCVILSAILLRYFKWQFATSESQFLEQLLYVIYSDFYRLPVLAKAYDLSEVLGTRILPYFGAGYVYSLLFFVPRSIAPFKGYSTALYFTSCLTNTDVNLLNWGFGIGLIEELLLNGGILLVIPGLVCFGYLMGICDRISIKYPSTTIPIRIGAIFLMGYHLPAILQGWGFMALFNIFLHKVFSWKFSRTRRLVIKFQ